MTLEEFAKTAGVSIVSCDPSYGGKFAYKTKDNPNSTICGYRTKESAYKGWLKDTFGIRSSKAVMRLIKQFELK